RETRDEYRDRKERRPRSGKTFLGRARRRRLCRRDGRPVRRADLLGPPGVRLVDGLHRSEPVPAGVYRVLPGGDRDAEGRPAQRARACERHGKALAVGAGGFRLVAVDARPEAPSAPEAEGGVVMSHIVVVGTGIAGTAAAFELRAELPKAHRITLVGPDETFRFVPSNPWVAVGWRDRSGVTERLGPQLARKGIDFVAGTVARVAPERSSLTLEDGRALDYDYLVLGTGPELAFDEIPGLGPDAHSMSICTLEHAERGFEAYRRFLDDPGPVVIGAVHGASCFGPAYEFALILDADLRRRKLRHKVPITFVTSEPYIGHMGLGGVGDSKGLMESEFRQHDIKWITNAKVDAVEADRVTVTVHDESGKPIESKSTEQKLAMLLPAFRGI